MDKKELGQLASEGKPLYGETDLPEYIQGVAHRNSMWSQASRQLLLSNPPKWVSVLTFSPFGGPFARSSNSVSYLGSTWSSMSKPDFPFLPIARTWFLGKDLTFSLLHQQPPTPRYRCFQVQV
jgi:hypothetical protein